MKLFGGLMFLLALAGFAVVDGFAGAAYAWLGIAEIDSEWLQMGTLALLIMAFMGAVKIAEVRNERERRHQQDVEAELRRPQEEERARRYAEQVLAGFPTEE